MRIAVIGSGIAGLGAAWLLRRCHEVTVFEAAARVGGHANTVMAEVGGVGIPVDTGFIVYNDVNYPNLIQLFERLGVRTASSNMSFSVSVGGRFEYAGSPGGLVADPRNLVRRRMWRLLHDALRFYREAPALLDGAAGAGLTLGAYLAREAYSRAFVADHLLPMGAAIWSSPPDDMLAFPAVSFVRFFQNHGLLQLKNRPNWRTVEGGSRCYVELVIRPFVERIRTGCAVWTIRRLGDRVAVDFDGGTESFDQVVIATHGDQALQLLGGDASPAERLLLGTFRYQANRAILHSDPALMPRRRGVWSSWNYLAADEAGDRPPSVTYWMNRLQNIDPVTPLFLSLNSHREPAPYLTHASFDYDHPVFSAAAIRAQAGLAALQGQNRTWFCGSYHGYGFHEDALASGCRVAAGLGAAPDWWATPVQAAAVSLPAAA